MKLVVAGLEGINEAFAKVNRYHSTSHSDSREIGLIGFAT